jgi:hypothetical protein
MVRRSSSGATTRPPNYPYANGSEEQEQAHRCKKKSRYPKHHGQNGDAEVLLSG